MKCKNGHEVTAGQKHCGECGEAIPQIVAKCTACNATFAKATAYCGECGVKQDVTGVDLDATIKSLEAFAKANVVPADTLGDLPEITQAEVDPEAVTTFLKAVIVKNDDGTESMKAEPVFKEIAKGQILLGEQVYGYLDHVRREAADARKQDREALVRMGDVIAKAMIVHLQATRELGKKFDEWGAKSRGRATALANRDPAATSTARADGESVVEIFSKSMGEAGARVFGAGEIDLTKVKTDDVIAKAMLAEPKAPPLGLISSLEVYQGLPFAAVVAGNPSLASQAVNYLAAHAPTSH